MSKKIVIGIAAFIVLIIVIVTAKTLISRNEGTYTEAEQPQQQIKPIVSKTTNEKTEGETLEEKQQRRERMRRLRSEQNPLLMEGFDPWLTDLKKAFQEDAARKAENCFKTAVRQIEYVLEVGA